MGRQDVPITPQGKDDLATAVGRAAERYALTPHVHARTPLEEDEDLAEVLMEAEEAAAEARAEAAYNVAEEHEAEEG